MKKQALLTAAYQLLCDAKPPEVEYKTKHAQAIDKITDVLKAHEPDHLGKIDSIDYDQEGFHLHLEWSVTAYGKEQKVTLQRRAKFRLYDETGKPCPAILESDLTLFLKNWREEARQLYKYAEQISNEAVV